MKFVVRTTDQLAKALRSRRKKLGLTQVQAARMVGLLPKTVSALEAVPGKSSVESLFRLLAALRVELELSPRSESTLEW